VLKNVETADYCVNLHLISLEVEMDGFEWGFVPIYGAAQEAQKPEFLAKLVHIRASTSVLMLVGEF
jgi:hypothetical protein